MKRLSLTLFSILLVACGEELPCAESALLAPSATTVSTGTAVERPARLNPVGCQNALALQAELTTRPAGSAAAVSLTSDSRGYRVTPDVAGRYTLRLTLGPQTADTTIVAIPAGGYEQIAGDLPCDRVAVGDNTVLCSEVGLKGTPNPARVFRKSDLATRGTLEIASDQRPAFGAGRYFLTRGGTLFVATEEPDSRVSPGTSVFLFDPGYYGVGIFSLSVAGARALAVASDGELRLVDASDAAQLEVTRLPPLPFFGRQKLALAERMAVALGSPLVPSGSSVEIAVLDLAQPAAPRIFLAPFAWSSLAFSGSRLVAAHDRGLDLFDLSADRGPLLFARNPEASGFSVTASATRIAVVNTEGVLVLGATDLNPQVFVPKPSAEQAALDADRLYVAGMGVLTVYRLTR
jgi:hypothetical protein